MELKRLKVIINRIEKDDLKTVNLEVKDLNNVLIKLTESCVDDIEILFNTIFDTIVEDEKLIEFYLEDDNSDLYKEVAEDVILQINSEIKQSESDFKKIIELNKE